METVPRLHEGRNASPLTRGNVPSRSEMLDRRAPLIVRRASQAGVDIQYMGMAHLFSGALVFPGRSTDWVIWPVDADDVVVLPRGPLKTMQALRNAGIAFPMTYVAHEVPKGAIENANSPGTTTDVGRARKIAGIVPPSSINEQQVAGLDRAADSTLRILRAAIPVLGAIALAPVVIAGAAVGGLMSGLDPVVFGVEPAGPQRAGVDAGWFLLTQWNW